MNFWRDPSFNYLPAQSHSDPAAFAKRMQARTRIAQRKTERPDATARPIKQGAKA